MNFTLRQLRYAVEIADTGHFGRAAANCNVTQSALSQQITQLEAQCAAPLFDRTSRPVALTPLGKEFVSRARHLLRDADELADFATLHRTLPDRPLTFALIPTVAPYLLPLVYQDVARQMADIQISAMERQTAQIISGLMNGSIDVGLIATELPEGLPLTGISLFADPFVLATPADYAIDAPVDLSETALNDLMLLEEGHCLRDQAIAACSSSGNHAGRPFAATSLSTIVELVANGLGVTLLPGISVSKEATDPRIAIHPLRSPETGRQLSLVWRRHAPFAGIYSRLADIIRAAGPTVIAPLSSLNAAQGSTAP